LNNFSVKDKEIVRALSVVKVPDDVLRRIDIRGVVDALATSSENVQKFSSDLEQARKEKKEGWILVNWLKGRGTKVEDLQYALQHSIGELTTTTTQLLIFNTAISRELSKQQEDLIAQQKQLRDQTLKIEKQNEDILAQQIRLEQQQKDINAANQGLLEAKGVTADQAKELIGCVVRVRTAESKLDESNKRLVEEVSGKIQNISNEVAVSLAQNNARLTEQISGMTAHVNAKIDEIGRDSEALKNKTSDEMNALSEELRLRMDEHLSVVAEAISESANSMQNALEKAAGALSASIDEKHSLVNSSMEALTNEQHAERSRMEIAIGAQVAGIRDDFGRRSKFLFSALVVVSCITLATAGVQIFGYIHH
jgi:hypothetical protein